MKLKKLFTLIALAGLVLLMAGYFIFFLPGTARAQDAPKAKETKKSIDPDADRIFRSACKYLTGTKGFCVKAEVWEDVVLETGQKIQTTKTMELQMLRPSSIHIEAKSPRKSQGFWYDGKTFTLLDRVNNFYGVLDTPNTVEKCIDYIEDRFGILLPLADIVVADPYTSAMENVITGDYLGKVTVLGVVCDHLSFTGANGDWQLWIAEGAKPLLKKIVINLKYMVGSPQYTAILSDWDLQINISDAVFTFVPPEGATKIDVKPMETEEKAKTEPADESPASGKKPADEPKGK